MEKEAIKTEGSKLCWMRSSLLASQDVIELQITEFESNLTKLIQNINIESQRRHTLHGENKTVQRST
jgi:hypothetical protein